LRVNFLNFLRFRMDTNYEKLNKANLLPVLPDYKEYNRSGYYNLADHGFGVPKNVFAKWSFHGVFVSSHSSIQGDEKAI